MSDDKRIERLHARLAEAQVQATESALNLFGLFEQPGTTQDLYGDVDGMHPVPPGGIPPYYHNNRGRGEVLPVYTSWLQLKYIRDRSRRLCRENEFAICATENRKNYVVGDGFTYRATGMKEDLNLMTQQLIDAWSSAIELAEYELDGMERLDMDGEFFLRFFYRDSGLLELRFVEPEHVKDAIGDPWSPAESFGVLTDIDDVEHIIGYNVLETPWVNETPTFVDGSEIMHVKLNVPRNAKRGLPTFYPVEGNLKRANDLLTSMSSMAKTRAKIALIRKFLNATGTAAQNMAQSLAVGTVTDPTTNQMLTLERMKYGTILNSTGNIDYEMPGANVDAGGFVEVLQTELRGIAARLSMPEWMLTANNDSTNYNQAFVSESHAVKAFRRLQRKLCRRFGESKHQIHKSVVWRQIEYAVKLGILPQEVLTEVKIQCEGPSLIAREKAEEAETNKVYAEMGIKSKGTISQELGLDRNQELANISKENQARVASVSRTAPIATQQQESVQGEPPDFDQYVLSKAAAFGHEERVGAEKEDVHPETGFILRSGLPVHLGPPVQRAHEHNEIAPNYDEMKRFGFPDSVVNSPGGPFAALREVMRRNGMVRFTGGRDTGSAAIESVRPLTSHQKAAIHEFGLRYKPYEYVFTRTPENIDDVSGYKHTFVKPEDLEQYLYGSSTRESVQKVKEKLDEEGKAHDATGSYVQPQWNSAEYPNLVDPLKKAEDIARRAEGLKGDYQLAIQAHADNVQKLQDAVKAASTGQQVDPSLLQQLQTDTQKTLQQVKKAGEAAESAQKELVEQMPGPMKPDWNDLDRILTSGPFHIVSAGRNGNNPAHEKLSDTDFAERHKALGDDLTREGFKHVEVNGKYGGPEEPSYLAVGAEDKAHVIRTLGFKYGQESVIHSSKGQHLLAHVTGPATNQAYKGIGFQYLDKPDDNYSEYTDSKGEKRRFTLNLDFDQLHDVTEAVAPQSGFTGFSANDFRDMLHTYLPPMEGVDETHDPTDVVGFYSALSDRLKSRTGHTLDEILRDHRFGKLHTDAGEAVTAAIQGGPYEGQIPGGWDSRKINKKGVPIGSDAKMRADPSVTNRRMKLDQGHIQQIQDRVLRTGHFPALVAFNPGHPDDGYGMIVAHKGAVNFPARDTPDLRQRVGAGDAAVLAKFGDVKDFLGDSRAVGEAQNQWKKLANSVSKTDLSTAIRGVQHGTALAYVKTLKARADKGDKTAAKLLKDFLLES